MKRFYWFILFACFSIFQSCDTADSVDSFPLVEYDDLITNNGYVIPANTSPIKVFNLFYNEFGYGEFSISGVATHTESAIVLDKTYTDEIKTVINKVKIYHVDYSTPGLTLSGFYVDLINTNNEKLSYCYKWQYKITNPWENSKKSTFCESSQWYINTTENNRKDWNILITH